MGERELLKVLKVFSKSTVLVKVNTLLFQYLRKSFIRRNNYPDRSSRLKLLIKFICLIKSPQHWISFLISIDASKRVSSDPLIVVTIPETYKSTNPTTALWSVEVCKMGYSSDFIFTSNTLSRELRERNISSTLL